MPQTLEETREALFRVNEQVAQLRRRLEQHEIIDDALRTMLSSDGHDADGADMLGQVFLPLRDMLRFDEALVMTGTPDAGLACEAATDKVQVGLLAAPGASAARALKGRVIATTAGHVLTALDDGAPALRFDPDSPALCAPFTFMGRGGFLLFLRHEGHAPFDRNDMDLARQFAVLAAQVLGIKAAEIANSARTRFLAGMSHELRTPLNGIIGAAAVLASTQLEPRQGKLVETIRESGKALLKVLAGLLDYVQLETGIARLEPLPFDLATLCEEALARQAAAAAAKGLALRGDCDATAAGLVIGDSGRLGEVIGRLLDNAVRFTAAGSVTLRLRSRVDGGSLVADFTVEDTGPGITTAERRAIFEPFAQGGGGLGIRPEGSGLGLTVCRLILREMNATLWLRSVHSGGSIFGFTVVLPRHQPHHGIAAPLGGLGLALITADDAVAERLAAVLGRLGSAPFRFGAVPRLHDLLDRLHGRCVVMIDETLLATARATWLMQARNPGILGTMPWLVIGRTGPRGSSPLCADLPRVAADATDDALCDTVLAAARALP